MICVYGQSGVGSFAKVGLGMKEAAEQTGLLAGFQLLDESALMDRELISAPVAVICGDPAFIANVHLGHKLRYLVLAPNSNGVPAEAKMFLGCAFAGRPRVEGLLAPSQWAADVLRREFPQHDVLVAPHGVGQEFRYGRNRELRDWVRAEYHRGNFFVVHVTSTATDRKGTPQLIKAWSKLGWGTIRNGGKMVIYCHPTHLEMHRQMLRGIDGVVVLPTMGMSDENMYLNYSAAHVVCQPSRAEGFGLVPLEALCSGVPVVATSETGHSQYMSDDYCGGYCKVFTGPDGPSDDYAGATAPTVTSDQIANALEYARTHWEDFNRDAIEVAPKLADEWTWKAQNEAPLRELVEKASRLEDT